MQSQTPQLSVRLLVLLLALFLVFLLIGRPAEAEAPQVTVEYVIEAGDTLWDIARSHGDGESDVRAVVADIQTLNGIESARIIPGQVILVPQG